MTKDRHRGVADTWDKGESKAIIEQLWALCEDMLEMEATLALYLDPEDIATCSKVISTSTLLLNDTLDQMLAHCRKARWFAMIGPSAGCLPDALFARGVTLLGGSWITEREEFIAALTSGLPHSEFTSKYALTSDGYPGWRDLTQRALKAKHLSK